VSQVESAPVVGVGWVHDNEQTADTLLGFEATPFFGVVASLGGGVWCLSCG
jgi:hypothetical protein